MGTRPTAKYQAISIGEAELTYNSTIGALIIRVGTGALVIDKDGLHACTSVDILSESPWSEAEDLPPGGANLYFSDQDLSTSITPINGYCIDKMCWFGLNDGETREVLLFHPPLQQIDRLTFIVATSPTTSESVIITPSTGRAQLTVGTSSTPIEWSSSWKYPGQRVIFTLSGTQVLLEAEGEATVEIAGVEGSSAKIGIIAKMSRILIN